MEALLLGGTGAMGVPLTQILVDKGYSVKITTRKMRESNNEYIDYLVGNAHEEKFISGICEKEWDVIVDFMSYRTEEFATRVELLLKHCKHYFFISSCRVYAEEKGKITEASPRLLEASKDEMYLKTDEYALAKARQEDILKALAYKNWTIIRPTITYSDIRLQLGVLEKEQWLYRAINGRSIVFSKDICDKLTTMTTAGDVAKGIAAIIGKEAVRGEIFHITSEKSYTWNELLECYLHEIEKATGKKPNVVMTEKAVSLRNKIQKYQIIYCRYYDRSFDNSKIGEYIDINEFEDPLNGLAASVRKCLEKRAFNHIDWKIEAWNDIAAKERTSLKEIVGWKNKVLYICYRNHFGFLMDFYEILKRRTIVWKSKE